MPDDGTNSSKIGIGLIGSGFMGRAHAFAFRSVAGLFPLRRQPVLELLADIDRPTAARAAQAFGFARATHDWQALVADPRVDIVSITAPTALHKAMALAAIGHGKTVYCEKPLGSTLAESKLMLDAAEAAGVTTLVGFNYLKNPLITLAKQMIDGGELGQLVSFRGIHAEDYMADPDAPFSWRCQPQGGGVLNDLGSHIIAMARYLCGDIAAVCGKLDTVHASRPSAKGYQPVTVDDQASALVEFANGASGSLHASWLAQGRKMQLEFELVGTKGSLAFSQARFNELKFYAAGQPPDRGGFTTIVAGPEHPDYGAFCPAPGHQLGFNDLKLIEVKTLLNALADNTAVFPDFREAFEVARVIEAIGRSSSQRTWVTISDV